MLIFNSVVIFFAVLIALTSPSSAQQGWIHQTSGKSVHMLGIAFTDSSTGIAVGESGRIVRTTDNGTT